MSIGRSVKTCSVPDGQTTVRRRTVRLGAEPEQQFLRVLRQEAGAGLHEPDVADDDRSRRVTRAPMASRLLAVPVRRMARAARAAIEVVAEHAQLRRLPRGHHDEVRIAVAIDVEHRERSPVLIEVEADGARHVVEAALSVVAQQHVALAAGDRSADEHLVDRPPRVVVRRALDARERRARDDLPPEEAVEVGLAVVRA